MQRFTTVDLLEFLYNETSFEKTAAIKAALETDWTLREEFELLSGTKNQLESVSYSPSQKTLNNILNYAEKAVEEELTPEA
jgi:hypothetical protein